jgi:ABC-type phosphate transport system substrate-binding protein
MLNFRNLALASACACIAGAVSAPNAAAQTYGKSDIFGGGASVPAPYARQTFDCYANPTDLIIAGSPPQFEQIAPFNYKGKKDTQDCATQHITTKATIWYVSTSAGPGILSVFGHDPTFYGYVDEEQTKYFPGVQYALSTTPLGSTDLNVYNNGGTETQGKSNVSIAAPGAESCTAGNNPYPNPLQCYGPLIQVPFAITPIVLAYNSIYEKTLNSSGKETDYHFNIQFKQKDGSGGLRLSPTTYCKIFNGIITNWNDPALTVDNGGVSLADPNDPNNGSWSVPLQIVGRSDSAGATSIFTRHLANVCAGVSGNQYTAGTSTLPTTLLGPTYSTSNPNYPSVSGETPGLFTLAPNNSGVAQYTAFTAVPGGSNPSNCTVSGATSCIQLGRITYSATDYVLPYVNKTQLNTYNLSMATLENASGQWEEATPGTALKAYSVIQPPQSNPKGKYCASCTNFGTRADPTAWVQNNSPSVLIANPTTSGAYPIVGTANWLLYTCYASKNQEKTLAGVFKYITNEAINFDPKKGILASAGLSPLSKAWRTAIEEAFITNKDKLGLQIEPAGGAGTCSQSGIIGG